jgi:predicted dehydrogenase/aryl-alcohol dehydrogenase-like predicted oxidoreductase
MSGKLAWGIIGTGAIAKTFARGLAPSTTGELLAVGSRAQESADKFGDEFDVPRRYGSYEALLADPDVQAVYISTPHPMHAEWAVKAAEAGKHILCEKPITLNYPDAMAVIEAARRNDVFLMEAYMYRCHPQIAKLVELIKSKAIGEVRLIKASFSFNAGQNFEGRLLKHEMGGGGILDVGGYTTSVSRLIAGAALGKDFVEPIEVKAMGKIGESRVDDYTAALLRFPGDIIAQISTGVQLNQENTLQVFGTEGNIFLPVFWNPDKQAGQAAMTLTRYGQPAEDVTVETDRGVYTYEADTVAANIANRQAAPPAMTWDDTLGNMRTSDTWRLGIGLVYDIEQPTANYPTIDNRPLTRRPEAKMPYGKIEGVTKPVARLIMGGTLPGAQFQLAHGSVMYDEYFRNGGNCFDTAYIYGNSDYILGKWIANRGIREDVVILAKGAHTPECNPPAITRQLGETLERMQTDYVDLYVLHRDNPEIPVGEFVDVLNEHRTAGRIRAFGGSNWSCERVQAANDYAKSKGLAGFSVVSNHFSLARMINPPWDGCIASSDPESREWFTKTQTPLLSWSSLAKGFFARARQDDLSDAMLVNCWYCEDNFQRLARATELAAKKGVQPVQIALAYLLSQPFPVFPLIGPEKIHELIISLNALSIEITPDEAKWLNLES